MGERIPRVVREAAHDPVVHVPDRVARQHEQVGGVKVRVEVPVDEHLVEHVPVEVAHDPVRVVTARPEGREVVGVLVPRRDHDLVERDPLDELRGQDSRRRVVAIHASNALEAFADRVFMEKGRLARLDEIVELVGRPARELVDDLPRFRPAEQPRPIDDAADRVHQADVRPEVGADPGPLHLDGYPFSGLQDRTMNLADRRGGKGPLLEPGEDLIRRRSQLLGHDRSDVVVGERTNLAEQLQQLGAVGRREEVEAHRQHLAELDPRATELLDGKAHAYGARFRRGPERELRQDEEAREDGQHSPQPAGVAEEGHHRAHLPAAAMSTGAVWRASPSPHRAQATRDRFQPPQSASSSIETRRRLRGRPNSSSQSRPASTSTSRVWRDHFTKRLIAPSAASCPLRVRRPMVRARSANHASEPSISARRRSRSRRANAARSSGVGPSTHACRRRRSSSAHASISASVGSSFTSSVKGGSTAIASGCSRLSTMCLPQLCLNRESTPAPNVPLP